MYKKQQYYNLGYIIAHKDKFDIINLETIHITYLHANNYSFCCGYADYNIDHLIYMQNKEV